MLWFEHLGKPQITEHPQLSEQCAMLTDSESVTQFHSNSQVWADFQREKDLWTGRNREGQKIELDTKKTPNADKEEIATEKYIIVQRSRTSLYIVLSNLLHKHYERLKIIKDNSHY